MCEEQFTRLTNSLLQNETCEFSSYFFLFGCIEYELRICVMSNNVNDCLRDKYVVDSILLVAAMLVHCCLHLADRLHKKKNIQKIIDRSIDI